MDSRIYVTFPNFETHPGFCEDVIAKGILFPSLSSNHDFLGRAAGFTEGNGTMMSSVHFKICFFFQICDKFHFFLKSPGMASSTVDGRNPAPVDRLFIPHDPSIYKALYISGGVGFLPSTVCPLS